MNGPWPAIDNWLDLVGNVWIGIVLIAVAAVPSYFARQNQKAISEVKHHVANGHAAPLRSDLDSVIQSMETLSRDIEGLRQELITEASMRRAQVQDLRDDVDRQFHTKRNR